MIEIIEFVLNIIIRVVSCIKILPLKKRGKKMTQTVCDNVSDSIYKGPCKLLGIIVDSDGANGDVTLYDGEGVTATKKIKCRSLSDYSFSPNIGSGIFFDKGIYILVNASTTTYTLIIDTEPWMCHDK